MALPRPLAPPMPVSRGGSWSLPDRWLPHVLLGPALAALVLVFAYPLAYSFWLSLHAYNITRPPRFIGLDNFALILQDSRVWESFCVSVAFALISLTLQFVIGFGICCISRDDAMGRLSGMGVCCTTQNRPPRIAG